MTGVSATHKQDARYWIPTENESYKAAYTTQALKVRRFITGSFRGGAINTMAIALLISLTVLIWSAADRR